MTGRDLPAVAEIYAEAAGERPPPSWEAHLRSVMRAKDGEGVARVAADAAGRVVGYVAGEVRSFEFGSPPAGWIFALAVAKAERRHGYAHALFMSAVEKMKRSRVATLRTMVSRDNVDVLRFFRGEGFVAGPYAELELSL